MAESIIGPDTTQAGAMFRDYLRGIGLRGLADRVSLSDCPLRTVLP